jgi:outer membrane receptor protein involved in Fe transport
VQTSADENGDNLFTSGNEALAPERIQTFEAEVSAKVGPARLRAAGFSSQVRDTIDRRAVETPVDGLGDLFYDNLGGSDVYGLEAQAVVNLDTVEVDGSWSWTNGTDLETGYRVYEFPPHMGHLRVGWRPAEALALNVALDAAGTRPRAEWSPDAGAGDAPGYVLVNLGARSVGLANGKVKLDLSLQNVFDSPWTTLVYRDDANATSGDGSRKFPEDLEGPGRLAQVGVEVAF